MSRSKRQKDEGSSSEGGESAITTVCPTVEPEMLNNPKFYVLLELE